MPRLDTLSLGPAVTSALRRHLVFPAVICTLNCLPPRPSSPSHLRLLHSTPSYHPPFPNYSLAKSSCSLSFVCFQHRTIYATKPVLPASPFQPFHHLQPGRRPPDVIPDKIHATRRSASILVNGGEAPAYIPERARVQKALL